MIHCLFNTSKTLLVSFKGFILTFHRSFSLPTTMDPSTIMANFFFIIKPHGSSLNSVTYKHRSNLHSNARLRWELSLTRNTERGNVIFASLHRWDRKWYSAEEVAEEFAEEVAYNGSDTQLTQSITLPNGLAKILIPDNLPMVTIGTIFMMNWLTRRTLKFIRNLPEVEVIAGPLKESVSAVEKVAPKWAGGVVSFVLLSVAVFGRFKEREPMNTSFKNVIGIDAVIPKFQAILSYLPPNISWYKPDGYLVYGPPRTGKTTLIHALAKQSGLPFFPINASDIVKIGTQEIKRLFYEARSSSPSLILIENIESIAAKRESGEIDPILRELRIEMDNCKKYGKEVAVIATTDKREKLDPTITNAGWFNHEVYVPTPDADGRREIVKYLLKDFMKEEDKELCNLIVLKTQGLVWGNIQHVCGLAWKYATDRGNTHVTLEDVQRVFKVLEANVHSQYAVLSK